MTSASSAGSIAKAISRPLLSSLSGQSVVPCDVDIISTFRRIHSRIVQRHEVVNVASVPKTDKNISSVECADPVFNDWIPLVGAITRPVANEPPHHTLSKTCDSLASVSPRPKPNHPAQRFTEPCCLRYAPQLDRAATIHTIG